MTETPTKGTYRRPSRIKAIVPMNFCYVPARRTGGIKPIRPRPLRDLLALREAFRTIDKLS